MSSRGLAVGWTPAVSGFFATSLGVALLHTVHASYFVDYVQRRHHALHFTDFALVQALLAAWHMTAEFLYGVCATKRRSASASGGSSPSTAAVKAGTVAAVAFLGIWTAPRISNVFDLPAVVCVAILAATIIAFDGAISVVNVHLKASLADTMVMSASERESAVLAGSLATLCGAFGAAIAGLWYGQAAAPSGGAREELATGRGFDGALLTCGLLSAGAFMFGGRLITTSNKVSVDDESSARASDQRQPSTTVPPSELNASTLNDGQEPSCGGQVSVLAALTGFTATRCALVIWFAQELCCTFQTNFFVVGTTVALIGWPPAVVSAALLASFVLPQVAVAIGVAATRRHSLQAVFTALLTARLIVGVLCAVLAPHIARYPPAVVGAMLLLRFCTEGVCKLQGLALSSICADVEHSSASSTTPSTGGDVASMLVGLTSLAAKPAQCLAPLIGSWLFFSTAAVAVSSSVDADHGELTAATILRACGVVAAVTAGVTIPAWAAIPLRRATSAAKWA